MAIERLQVRRGTAAEWTAANTVLASGEPGMEVDTGKVKYGDGVTPWGSRPYASEGEKGDQGVPGVADDPSVTALIENTGSATRGALNATYDPKGAAAAAVAPVSAAVTKSRRIATSPLTQGMLTAPVMTTPPTFTYNSSLFAGYVVGATSATTGWPNNTAIRPSGAPLAPPNEFGATYPLGPDSQLTIFDGSVHFDFDCPDQTFVFRTQITSTGRFRIWVDGKPHAAAPVLLSTLAATSSSPGYVKVDLGSRATSRRISIELEGVKPNATGTPLPFYGVWKETAGSVWPTSISSARMVVLGDSYGKGIGASVAADAYPVQLGRLLGITDVLHFTCVSSTGIMKGTTTNSYRTRLQKIIDAAPDIVLFQGSINDADGWPAFQGQIGPQFKLDVATLRAGLPNAIIIVTSPLEVRVATSAELAVRDELKTAALEEGLPFIDILGTTFFNGTGKAGSRTVADGVTTSGSTTITSATAAFTSGTDAGRIITGAGIPTGTTIASLTDSTTAVLSVAATASATGVSLTITAQKGDGNADYFVAATADDSSGAHPSSAGHLAIAKLLAGKIAPLIGATAA